MTKVKENVKKALFVGKVSKLRRKGLNAMEIAVLMNKPVAEVKEAFEACEKADKNRKRYPWGN